jgi:hypothetical protein
LHLVAVKERVKRTEKASLKSKTIEHLDKKCKHEEEHHSQPPVPQARRPRPPQASLFCAYKDDLKYHIFSARAVTKPAPHIRTLDMTTGENKPATGGGNIVGPATCGERRNPAATTVATSRVQMCGGREVTRV